MAESSHSLSDYAPCAMTTEQSLPRGACTIAYEISCESAYEIETGEAGELAPVVLLHGFAMDRRAMRPLARGLRERLGDVQTIALDLRGHGATRAAANDAAHDYPAMRDDLLALLEHCAPAGAHLVGHSMGGQIALMAAIAQPDRVHSLCLIGAGPCRAVTEEREHESWQRAAKAFETSSPEKLAASLASAAATEDPALTPEALYGDARGEDLARVVRGGFLRVVANDDACRTVSTPTLLIAGSRDEGWLAPTRKLAGLIVGSELDVVQDAGHLVHLEQPEQCARTIAAQLARLAPRATTVVGSKSIRPR
jgi:pimeloyl-ACP methyl ester carboxylesterase